MDNLKITPAEIREKVFLMWYSLGRNDTSTAIEAKKQGFNTSRQSVSVWKQKYGWVARADGLDLLKLEREKKASTARDRLLEDLYSRKEEYETFFKNLPPGKVDNQATYAYGQICNQIERMTSSIEKTEAVIGSKEGRTFKIRFVEPDESEDTP